MDYFIYIIFYIHRIESKNYLVIYNNQGYYTCDVKDKPNDIFESGNIIVTVEKNFIEVFEFSETNNKNNLIKKSEIKIDNNNDNNINNNGAVNNNNNFINNNNINNDNGILCIEYALGFFICGHSSGLMSIWKPEPKVYLQRIQGQTLHNGPINKILYTKLSDNKNYLISCSSDKTIKIYCMDDNNIMKTVNFDEEVFDVKLVKDFNKNSIFIISLKNGVLKALNETFNFLFDIPSRFQTSSLRRVIPLTNPNSNETKGDLLAITEGRFIDMFTWIKEGSFIFNPHNKPNHPHKGNQHFPYNPNPIFRGGRGGLFN